MKSLSREFVCSAIVGVLLCGCVDPPPVDEAGNNDTKGIVQELRESSEGHVPLFRVKVSDRNFRFTIDGQGIPKLETLNEKATLEELMDFAKTTCWNSRIQPILSDHSELSLDDALLISFVLDVERAVIQAISLAMHDSVIGTDSSYGLQVMTSDVRWEEYRQREHDFIKPFVTGFLQGDSTVRSAIRVFGQHFAGMTNSDKEGILQSIYRGDFAEDVRGESARHPWYWYTTTTGQNMTKSEIERSAVNIEKHYKEYSDEWNIIRKHVIPYLHETWRSYKKLDEYFTSDHLKDSRSRNLARILIQDSVASRDLMLENFCYQLYDLPFTILTYRSVSEYRDCKGFWNDDEDAMRQVATRFGDTISGAEMLKHVESRYARDVYTDFIEALKDDLGDEVFKTVAHQARLLEFAKRENERDAETGLRKNSSGDSNQ